MQNFNFISLLLLLNIISLDATSKADRTQPVVTTEELVAEAKAELEHAHETAALHKQHAKEQIVAKQDQHQIDIAALELKKAGLENEISKIESRIAELRQQHAQELFDLQKTHEEQEKTDTETILAKELEVGRTQALLNRMYNEPDLGKRGEHWGPGAVTG
jgi:hypothetical protein